MTTAAPGQPGPAAATEGARLHSLDALRGFALLCGVVLHAATSYLAGFEGRALPDRSTSAPLTVTYFAIHVFRMTLFFVIAGFFARLLVERRGVRAFVRNRSLRIVVPLVVGWIVFYPMVVAARWWGMGGQLPSALWPRGVLRFPLAHLWFLWVLALVYMAALPTRWLVRALDAGGHLRARFDALFSASLAGPWAPFVLSLPLVAAFLLSAGRSWSGIPTPNRSLLPNLPAAVAYSVAFLCGWLLHRQTRLLATIERQWPTQLALATALSVGCWWMLGGTLSAPRGATASQTAAFRALYAAGAWAWTLALIGIALRFFSGESRARRYVSDASYWIYLAHLPVVYFLQAAMLDLPLHWAVKFPIQLTLATAFLFATYHWLVRFTFVGEVLNGTRHRSGGWEASPLHVATATGADTAAPLAQLGGVRKNS